MSLRRVSRLPGAPLWAILAVAAWLVLAGALALLDQRLGLGLGTCLFKQLTGHPCPTCGSTRGALALLAGQPLAALKYNPMVFAGLALAGLWFGFRACTGLQPELGPRARRAAWALAAAALLGNWIYLWSRGI